MYAQKRESERLSVGVDSQHNIFNRFFFLLYSHLFDTSQCDRVFRAVFSDNKKTS